MWPADFPFTTPTTIAVAILVAVMVGLSKGGLGGTMAIIGVAILAMIMPPVQAAGILLPILIVMDFVGCWIWRGKWDLGMIRSMLPAAILGVGVGWLTAAFVSDAAVRLIIGAIAAGYLVTYARSLTGAETPPKEQNPRAASFWGLLSGYGSFVAHAGGPAYQVYAMPLKATPVVFTSTSTLFFTLVNLVKLVPYAALGQFGGANLLASAVLMPIAAIATLAGAALVRRMSAAVFYPILHLMLLVLTIKLVWDGIAGL